MMISIEETKDWLLEYYQLFLDFIEDDLKVNDLNKNGVILKQNGEFNKSEKLIIDLTLQDAEIISSEFCQKIVHLTLKHLPKCIEP